MASSTASESVGCAWIVLDHDSSVVASSPMRSHRLDDELRSGGPIMWTPRISPYFESETTLTKPSCFEDPRGLAVRRPGTCPS